MATLDIRDEQELEITAIKYRDKGEPIIKHSDGVAVGHGTGFVCRYDEIDDFKRALDKAKELWHKD